MKRNNRAEERLLNRVCSYSQQYTEAGPLGTTPLHLIAAERDQDWDQFSGTQHSAFKADSHLIDYINCKNELTACY